MKFYKKSTFKLTRDEILEIINLKNSHWNYGFLSQLNWFKNKTNVFKSDLHFFIKNNKKLIAYVQLGKRNCFINKKKSKYILFRTLIVLKKERSKYVSTIIMKKVLRFVKSQNLACFLLCKKTLISFYKKNGFIKLNKKNFKIIDHKNYLNGMIYNLKKKDKKKEKQFYYNN